MIGRKHWYWLLIGWALRCAVLLQPGYIHPDEFFQNPESMAGHVLNITTLSTWEFSSDRPIRSTLLPLMSSGLSLSVGKLIFPSALTSQNVLLLTRLPFVLLGMLNDWLILWITSVLFDTREITGSVLFCLLTSYLPNVYLIRPFSNSMETFLFTGLLALLVKLSKNHGQNGARDINRTLSLLTGLLLIAGFFNRPTFLVFAGIPLLLALYELWNSGDFAIVARFAIGVLQGSVLGALLFTANDTWFFRRKELTTAFHELNSGCLYSLEGISNLTRSVIAQTVSTPWNFIAYNMNADNLATHGRHPWYMHLTVNSVVLYGLLALVPVLTVYRTFSSTLSTLNGGDSRSVFGRPLALLAIYAAPVLILSIFPHQEPRFLLPLLAPLLLLLAALHFNYRENALPCVRVLTFLHVMFNLLAFMFYAYAHQAGIVPSLAWLQHKIFFSFSESASLTDKVIFFHTYMPPRYLLMPPPEVLSLHNHIEANITILDLAGAGSDILQREIANFPLVPNLKTWVVAPSVLDVGALLNRTELHALKRETRFSLHLGLDDAHAAIDALRPTLSVGDFLQTLSTLRDRVFGLEIWSFIAGL